MERKVYSNTDALMFLRIFGEKLSSFWCSFTGLDVVALDDYLKVPDGKSTKEFIKASYGDEALQLVEHLMTA